MKLHYWLVALAVVSGLHLSQSLDDDFEVVEVVGLIKTALGVVKFVTQTWNELLANTTGLSLPELGIPSDSSGSRLLTRFRELSGQLQSLENNIGTIRQTLRHIQHGIPAEVRWELTVETMENLLRPINSNYKRFLYYQQHGTTVEPHTLQDFANNAVSHGPMSLQSTMSNLHHLVKGLGMHMSPHERRQRYAFKQGLFRQLNEVLTASETKVCELEQSPQQLAYGLYGIISLTLAKGYAMIQFSYMLLRSQAKGNFTVESRLATETYEQMSFDVAAESQEVIRKLSNSYWRCDPSQHVSGVTYEQVTELLQGYMENEVDLNPDGTCNNNCAYYNHAKRRGCYMVGSDHETGVNVTDQKRGFMICDHQRACRGKVHDCRFFDSDSTVCFADGRDASNRRYDWIQFEDGQSLGRVGRCSDSRKVDSWWRNLFWHCSYCFCLCDDETNSDRYFSLQPQVADVAENMVLTGVRWIKRDRVFYIQIQQGQVDRFGFVNASSVHWKPIKNQLDITKAIADRDFMALSWERRAVDLDDLKAPDGHLITGVSFRKLGEHLNLEIQVTPIAARTARLSPSRGYWMSNDLTPSSLSPQQRRREFTAHDGGDLSTRSPGASWPDSPQQSFLRFGASSLRLDAAQTTLPFLDLQSVAPRPAVWITGLGLYHKGSPGYGGFLGLRLQTVDLTSRVALDEDGGFDDVIQYESREVGAEDMPLVV